MPKSSPIARVGDRLAEHIQEIVKTGTIACAKAA